MRWYDCPKCGKPESSDGEHFCGACEEHYQAEQKSWREQEQELAARMRATHADDCDCLLCQSRMI